MVNPELRKPVSALSKYVTEPGREPGLRVCLFTPSGFPETPRAAAPPQGHAVWLRAMHGIKEAVFGTGLPATHEGYLGKQLDLFI